MRPARRIVPGALAGALFVACSPLGRREPHPDVPLPERWGEVPAEVAPAPPASAPEAWWRAFDSPELDALVDEALAYNRDLHTAAARVLAAEAAARAADAGRMPTVDAGATARRQKQIFVGLPVPGTDVLESLSTTYGLSLDVAWEPDLWGRLSSAARAAEGDLAASAADLAAAHVSLAGRTTRAWFAWQESRLQRTLAERSVRNREQSAELVRRRFDEGRGSAVDVRLSDASVADARAQVEAWSVEEDAAARQLDLLAGRYPSGAADAPVGLPELPADPPLGVPGDLLARRPDLVAAQARLFAADERLASARADLYPRLSFAGAVGRTSDATRDLLDPDFSVWSIAAGLVQPLFDGGRRRAGVDVADARVAEALAGFEAQLLAAVTEVETSRAAEQRLARYEAEQRRASEASTAAAETALERYAAGREGLLTVLDAQRRALEAESRWITVRRRLLSARVDLHLALGGGFGDATTTETATDSVDD